jgi:hypothetical protein
MSIVRVGLAETKGFAEGYEAIFGKKKDEEQKKDEPSARDRPAEQPKEPPKE